MDRTTLTGLLRDLAWSAVTVAPALLIGALPPTLWDEVTGLPGHPLVVHAAVVVIPVAAVLLVAAAARPALRGRLRSVLPPLLGVAAVAAVLPKRTGDSLSAAVGLPAAHAEWGTTSSP